MIENLPSILTRILIASTCLIKTNQAQTCSVLSGINEKWDVGIKLESIRKSKLTFQLDDNGSCTLDQPPKTRLTLSDCQDTDEGLEGRLEFILPSGRFSFRDSIADGFVNKICIYLGYSNGVRQEQSSNTKYPAIMYPKDEDHKKKCLKALDNIVSESHASGEDATIQMFDTYCETSNKKNVVWLKCESPISTSRSIARTRRNALQEGTQQEKDIHLNSLVFTKEILNECPSGYSIKPRDSLIVDEQDGYLCLPNTCTCEVRDPAESDYSYLKDYCGMNFATEMGLEDVAGNTSERGSQWPWLVYIHRTASLNKKAPHCTGAILNPRFIITAAHCFFGGSGQLHTRVMYIANSDNTKIISTGKQLIPHKEYNTMEYNDMKDEGEIAGFDIGLIYLDPGLTFNKMIRPICINSEQSHNHLELRYATFLTRKDEDYHEQRLDIHILPNLGAKNNKISVDYILAGDQSSTYNRKNGKVRNFSSQYLGSSLRRCRQGFLKSRSGGPLIIPTTDYHQGKLVQKWLLAVMVSRL